MINTNSSAMVNSVIESPVGWLRLAATDKGLAELVFVKERGVRQSHPILDQVTSQLQAYFQGQLHLFEVKYDFQSGTPFQQLVWQTLTTIPYGQVVSYKTLAERVGSPKAVRAVGGANGKNPIAIIIPCHRVIGHDGRLGGYSSGLDRKRWLLAHENVVL